MFKEWLALADAAPWWPAPLRVAITEATSEQAVFSALMRSDAAAWSEAIRKATSDVVAKIVHERVFPTSPPEG
jgi:hypothetical protein